MGHHEQIGAERRRLAVERARLPYWRRIDWFGVFAVIFGTAFWSGLIYIGLRKAGII